MRAWPIITAILLTGCGIKAEDYPARYAEAYCEWAVVDQCLDEATREFFGWEDLDSCVPDFGGRYAAETEGCIFDKKAAKQCLKEMKKYGCENAPDVPEVCEVAFICDEGTEDSGA